jgi:hypothetical protein
MSEYQYYEFRAVDRPLDAAARAALRDISSRAQITASSFANEYNWGDLKADPIALMHDHFDLFFYTGFYSSRRFAMRVPKRLADSAAIERFDIDDEFLTIHDAGDNLIFDVSLIEIDIEPGGDDTGWLSALAPLRAAVMSGDLRFFYMLWLMQAGFADFMRDDAPEPLPGLAPLDGALSDWADFLGIDGNLVAAAAEAGAENSEPDEAAVDRFLRSLSEADTLAILRSVYAGDNPHLSTELRRRCRPGGGGPAQDRRTAGALREAAARLAAAEAEKQRQRADAERRRKAAEEAKAKAARLARLTGREPQAWQKVELLVEQRNRSGYAEAADLLLDLREIVAAADFARKLEMLRIRHASKRVFIEHLDASALK